MKKLDVIVVGELNVDLILNGIDGFPVVGKEILADQMELALGSSSAICASNLSSLGLKVGFLGMLGNDVFGQFVIEQLEKKGVDTSMIIVEEDLKTGATIALSYGEDRAMITHQGAMKHLTLDDIESDKLHQAGHVHFSSYFLQPGLKGSLDVLFQRARQLGLTTSLDMQWDPAEQWDLDLQKTLPYVDVFLPNETELLKLTGAPDLAKAIQAVQDLGKYLVVKCGSKGSVLCYEKKTIEKPAFLNEDVVDTIGAGDSFNAGYIYQFVKGASPEKAQIFGNVTGAVSTTQAGGTNAFTNFEEVMKLAKKKFNYTEG
ncbi:MAG: carbohydrate kinase family protein [Cyclobacteriaceae bacterium]